MHPGARLVLLPLGETVRLVPVALGLLPECLQRRACAFGRRVPVERCLECLKIHHVLFRALDPARLAYSAPGRTPSAAEAQGRPVVAVRVHQVH